MKINWLIYRFERTDKGTLSVNFVKKGDFGFEQVGYNVELPFRANCIGVSCIPDGLYKYEVIEHARFGRCIRIDYVPHRSGILIHAGNNMKETQGCIMPCMSFAYSKENQIPYGIMSRNALSNLIEVLPDTGYIQIVSLS